MEILANFGATVTVVECFDINEDPYIKLCVTSPVDGSQEALNGQKIAKMYNFGAPRDPYRVQLYPI